MSLDQLNKPTTATRIMELLDGFELFKDQQQRAILAVPKGQMFEYWNIESEEFSQWLSRLYFETFKSVPGKASVKDAVYTLKGKATFGKKSRTTYQRSGIIDGGYNIDLCRDDWACIEVNRENWTVFAKPRSIFMRSNAQQPLPIPNRQGDIEELWQFLNIADRYRPLAIAWIIECWRPETDYPLVVLEGEQGSAKSTTQSFLKLLVDPSASYLRQAPRDAKELFIGANSDMLLSFNNVSSLKTDVQDAMCCLATGGTYSARKLFSDATEVMINIKRPVILNGIASLITRQDLMERTLFFETPLIGVQKRLSAAELHRRFDRCLPGLLGSVFDVMVDCLAKLDGVPQDNLHRLADFNLLLRALALRDCDDPYAYDELLHENQLRGITATLEASPIFRPLQYLLEKNPVGFYGTFSELERSLRDLFDGHAREWPCSQRAFVKLLKRDITAFRRIGINIKPDPQRKSSGYYVGIECI